MKKIYLLFCLLVFSANVSFAQSLTSDEIVQKYIDAIGGIDELKKMKQITLIGKADVMGQNSDLLAYEDSEEKYQFARVNGEGFDIKTYFDMKGGWIMQNGIKQEVTGEQHEKLKTTIADGTYFYLTDMESRGIKTELLGEENIEGTDTYKIKFTRGDTKSIKYFSKETFYLIRVQSQSTNGTEIILNYSDYRQVPETKLIMPYITDKGPIKGTVEKYEINVPLNPMLLLFDK